MGRSWGHTKGKYTVDIFVMKAALPISGLAPDGCVTGMYLNSTARRNDPSPRIPPTPYLQRQVT